MFREHSVASRQVCVKRSKAWDFGTSQGCEQQILWTFTCGIALSMLVLGLGSTLSARPSLPSLRGQRPCSQVLVLPCHVWEHRQLVVPVLPSTTLSTSSLNSCLPSVFSLPGPGCPASSHQCVHLVALNRSQLFDLDRFKWMLIRV